MRKYGVEQFTFTVVETVFALTSKELSALLNQKETANIQKYGSKSPNGYTLTDGGEGLSGMEFSDEHREKIRLSKLGKRRPESVIAVLTLPKTEEHRNKLRKPKTEEHKSKAAKAENGRI